ncbi:Zn-ribbon domain-containing OB-fold protein [Halosegnis sp.]|uniref:Zn-ribbon domain-containing OB-fold protein n=1 Tax=Halosegnis sp. TaxID=2864959 RepID=UPI0035D40C04
MSFDAGECPNGHLSYPTHLRCPECGEPQEDRVDLSGEPATVVTWTTSYATPPGVREPNTMAIVEFDDHDVRALGQVTTDEVEIGDAVRPVHVDEVRTPGAGIREPASQEWDGYRFEPL